MACAAFGYTFDHWGMWLIACFYIALLQHVLLVLAHEGAHGRELPAGKLAAWSLFLSFDGFKRAHSKHHRHVMTPLDPDPYLWRFTDPLTLLLRMKRAGYITWRGLIAAALLAPMIPWWVIPAAFVLPYLQCWRYSLEHEGGPPKDWIPRPWERVAIAHMNIQYHRTHHDHPQVSHWRLPAKAAENEQD